MAIPKKLGTKSHIEMKQVRAILRGEVVDITTIGEKMPYPEISKKRVAVDAQVMFEDLERGGHIFANMGASVILTTDLFGKHYSLLAYRDGGDFNAMFPSGFIPVEMMTNPLSLIHQEISEEILPTTTDEFFLSGVVDGNLKLPQVFSKKVRYARQNNYTLEISDAYTKMPGIVAGTIFIDDIQLENAGIYFDAANNCCQLVFAYDVELPSLVSSLNHSEDKFRDAKGMDILFHEYGILLVELENGEFTDQVFTLQNSELIPFTDKIVLSEVFATDDDGITRVASIDLGEYLKR